MTHEPTDVLDPSALAHMDAELAVDALVHHAAGLDASDLFLLTDERSMRISIRRMGAIEEVAYVSREQGRHLISHVKAMSGMDIADQRRPGEGRWLLEGAGKRLDLRVSCMSTLFGEDMTLRIWNRDSGFRELDQLGFSQGDLKTVKNLLSRPSGLILVTGPTGAGKTTTLYSCLQQMNDGTKKINTLEDPIEYALEGVRQSQVNHRIQVDFPQLLRTVVRQAPDIIMIGEVRDEETSIAAVRAANSGHLVLATLHSPIAASALQSMLALGALPYFLSACLLGVIAQRLIRTLCPDCRLCFDISESPETFAEIEDLLSPGEGKAIYGPTGCEKCRHTGYAGQTGLFEIMTMNYEIRKLLAESRPAEEIEEAAIRNGMIEFRRGALQKVAQGATSTEEILRDVPAEFLGLED